MPDIFEISRNHRVEGLFHQAFDIAKALDYEWCLLVVNVHDNRKRQVWLKGILGNQRNFGQVFIEMMRADFIADPLQDDVGGWDRGGFPSIGIEGIFARQQWLTPNTAVALGNMFTMSILQT